MGNSSKATEPAQGLERRLTGLNLLLMGIGAIVGAGIFVMTGTAAAHYGGPAIVVSFAIAAVACLCSGLCYAELASIFPVAGSAYSYTRAALGSLAGWAVGWCLLLEYLVAAGAISAGWAGYFAAACADVGIVLPHGFANAPLVSQDGQIALARGSYFNVPAAAIVLILTVGVVGSVRASAFINNVVVAAKIVVIALFLVVGALYVDPANWHPFLPPNTGEFGHFGWSGVLRGAGVVFFAYLGFDAVSTAAQEARNPQRDIPRAIIGSLIICTALYILMALVMTGLTSYRNLAVPHPVSVAIRNAGSASRWLEPIIDVGVLAGLTSVIFALVFAQSRVLYSMSRDGLLPAIFAKIHPRFHTPYWSVLLVGSLAAVLGGLLPLEIVGTLVSMGTLFAFMMVCIAVLRLRRTQPSIARSFRLPFSPYIPILGILICAYLMSGLGGAVWLRFIAWFAAGAAFYLVYNRARNRSVRPGRSLRVANRFCFLVVLLAAAKITPAQVPPLPGVNQPDMPIDAREQREVIASLVQAIHDTYVFPDVAAELVKTLEERQALRAYEKLSSAREFSERLNEDLYDVAHDRHLRLIYSAQILPPMSAPTPGQSPLAPDAEIQQRTRLEQTRNNYRFEKLEHLRGNIGYLKLDAFADAAAAGDRVTATMTFLADTDALIIDLRENRGGTPAMVQLLASYFFSGDIPVHLNDLAWRRMGSRAEDLTQWWTLSYLPGKRYLDREVYILTSRMTFSAAEEFTYDLQALGRATIVGETSGGGANPGGFRRLREHFAAFIPTGHAINPVTGTNWEGKGVQPDVRVPAEDALSTAHRTALQHLIDKAPDERQLRELREALASLQEARLPRSDR